jgi:hypothetical protein
MVDVAAACAPHQARARVCVLSLLFIDRSTGAPSLCPYTFTTGCSSGGCPANTEQISRSFCPNFYYNERCQTRPSYYGGCCPGWTGSSCFTRLALILSIFHLPAVCSPGCVRGTCFAPNKCRCPAGSVVFQLTQVSCLQMDWCRL